MYKYSATSWPACRIRLFTHYTISLSSSCRPFWSHWTYKMFVRYILSSVCLRLSEFSQFSFMPLIGLCVFSLNQMFESIALYVLLSITLLVIITRLTPFQGNMFVLNFENFTVAPWVATPYFSVTSINMQEMEVYQVSSAPVNCGAGNPCDAFEGDKFARIS